MAQEIPAVLVFQGISITTFRTSAAGQRPAERAESALRRLESLHPPFSPNLVRIVSIPGGEIFFAGNMIAFAIMEGDLDISLGQSLGPEANAAKVRLLSALRKRELQSTPGYLVRALAFSLLATVGMVLGLLFLLRMYRGALRRLTADSQWKRHYLAIRGFDVSGPVAGVLSWVTRVLGVLAALTVLYLWMMFLLNRFPYTQPWGRAARGFLFRAFDDLASGFLGALPGVFLAAAILLITRGVASIVKDFFTAIERGTISMPGFHPETVGATRRLVNVLIWLFAVVIAYPFLPGSNSPAFKGVSVFLGLLVTLGSAGVVGHMMSGLVLVYSRALKKGDYVRVGDVEGSVIEVGPLSTKIANRKDEEFTIPNTVMVGTTIKNFSRLAGQSGSPLTTKVTIGYDAPWRVVHEMLKSAAARTPGLRKEPAPFVVQAELSDFYVEYQLVARLESPDQRILVMSVLHQNIQDAFNERGVQIMSPHFEGQPERPVLVPKSKWHSTGGDTGETPRE